MRQRIILALVIALAASGCQKKATGQSVAVVNGEEITTGELNDAMSSDQSLAGASTKDARVAELQKLVDRKLLVQQARADGIDKTPEFINRQRRTNDDLLIGMLVSKRVNTSQLPSADEISRFETSRPEMFANREIWTLQQIIYPLPQNAAVTAQLKAAKIWMRLRRRLRPRVCNSSGTRRRSTPRFSRTRSTRRSPGYPRASLSSFPALARPLPT